MNATDYIGLEKRAAQNKAEKDNLIFRLVSVDGRQILGPPSDDCKDRICITIDNGKVSSAEIK